MSSRLLIQGLVSRLIYRADWPWKSWRPWNCRRLVGVPAGSHAPPRTGRGWCLWTGSLPASRSGPSIDSGRILSTPVVRWACQLRRGCRLQSQRSADRQPTRIAFPGPWNVVPGSFGVSSCPTTSVRPAIGFEDCPSFFFCQKLHSEGRWCSSKKKTVELRNLLRGRECHTCSSGLAMRGDLWTCKSSSSPAAFPFFDWRPALVFGSIATFICRQ